MRRRADAMLCGLLSAGCLALPASALAGTGGAGVGSDPGPGTGAATAPTPPDMATRPGATTQPADTVASASGAGITFTARTSALYRRSVRFAGRLAGGNAGTRVLIQRMDPRAGWQTAATAMTAADGTFATLWRADHHGRLRIRALPASATAATSRGSTDTPPPVLGITVYTPATATQYGTGFYGHTTACGITLQPDTVGVAHRTLPCGTKVSILYGGRTIVVPVIDRGPYANHADWDLTEATGRALGVDGTATVGALPLPRGDQS